MLTVLSRLHAADTCTCHSIILSLLVIVWLHLVPTSITGIRGNQTVHEGDNLRLACD